MENYANLYYPMEIQITQVSKTTNNPYKTWKFCRLSKIPNLLNLEYETKQLADGEYIFVKQSGELYRYQMEKGYDLEGKKFIYVENPSLQFEDDMYQRKCITEDEVSIGDKMRVKMFRQSDGRVYLLNGICSGFISFEEVKHPNGFAIAYKSKSFWEKLRKFF